MNNSLHVFVNDFKLCDIINGRRKIWIIDVTPTNCKQIVSCNQDGQPLLINGKMIPVYYTHVLFESNHITLKGEQCRVEIKNTKTYVRIQNGVKSSNPYFGHQIILELGKRCSTTIETDYTML